MKNFIIKTKQRDSRDNNKYIQQQRAILLNKAPQLQYKLYDSLLNLL